MISGTRITWIDSAKAYGIYLVFLGHVLERFIDLGNGTGYTFFKLIYSFHMPFFFILSGYLASQREKNIQEFITKKLRTRIYPLLFFNFLGLLEVMALDLRKGSFAATDYVTGIFSLFAGQPSFNVVTWFLVCLLSVEVIHYFIYPLIRRVSHEVVAIIAFYCIGIIATQNYSVLSRFGESVANFWYLREAILAFSFYQIGHVFQVAKKNALFKKSNLFLWIFLIGTIVLFITYNKNGVEIMNRKHVIKMVDLDHGNPIFFGLTALSGAVALISLAVITPGNRYLSFIGKNSLIFMGLNGILFTSPNTFISRITLNFIPDSFFAVFCSANLICIVSLLGCIPAVAFINKHFPAAVGRRYKV